MAKKVFKTKPQIVLADVNDDRSVELAWKGVPEAEGYLVERYDNAKEKFLKLASLPANSSGFCSKEELNDGVYQYRISAFKAVEGKTKPAYSRSVLRAVNISSIPAIEVTGVESTSFGKVTVFWKKAEGAEGYVIKRRIEGMDDGVIRGEADKGSSSFTDDSAVSGQVYYYDVQSFSFAEDGTRFFSNTGREKCFVCLDRTEVFEVKRGLSKKVTFFFRMTAGIDCYVLFRSDSENGEFKEVSRTKNGETLSLSDKGEPGKKEAWYFIRCCKKVGGEEIFGEGTDRIRVKYR